MRLQWLTLAGLLLCSAHAQGDAGWRVLYRPDLVPTVGTVSPGHARLLTPQVLNAQPGACRARSVEVLSARSGQFVQATSPETLYLYRSDCDDALRFILVRAGRPVHGGVLARPNPMSRLAEAYVMQDIDRDGRQEVVTVFEVADSSGGARWLSLWSLASGGKVRRLATFWTERIHCELADPAESGRREIWNLFVRPGHTPQFSADAFVSASCADSAPQVQVGRKGAPARPGTLQELYW